MDHFVASICIPGMFLDCNFHMALDPPHPSQAEKVINNLFGTNLMHISFVTDTQSTEKKKKQIPPSPTTCNICMWQMYMQISFGYGKPHPDQHGVSSKPVEVLIHPGLVSHSV